MNTHQSCNLQDPSDKLIHFQFYPNKDSKLKYLNTFNELYALPNGTGAVYKLSKTKSNTFERIDSTLFQGYNNDAINFIHKDTIFSLGGYGLWHYNGQLRYFNIKKAEWELKPIDYLLPITSEDFVDVRTKKGIVYVSLKKLSTEGSNQQKEQILDSVYSLNIVTGEVKRLGKATEQLRQITKNPISLSSNYGTILLNSKETILLDFEHNEIKSWEAIKIGDLFLSGLGSIRTLIQNDSIIYYFNNNTLDSLVIPIQKMKTIGSIYTNSSFENFNQNKSNLILYIILIIAILAIFTFLVYKNKNKQRNSNKIWKEHQTLTTPLHKELYKDQFTNIELELIQLLLNQVKEEEKLNVESLNAILGVTKKSTEVQRKQRSQIIASINVKAKEILNFEEDLIIRIKNETDSRIVTYSIQEKYTSTIASYFKL